MALDMTSLWSILGFISLLRGFLPREFTEMLEMWWSKLLRPAKRFSQFQIPENDGSGMSNDLYRVVKLYLGAANLCTDADELVLSRKENDDDITYNLAGKMNNNFPFCHDP
jgi:hypothetical protein